jgi:hypothetical protein
MSRRLRQKLVVLGIGSVAAISIGAASAQSQPGEPPRQPGEPPQQDTRFNPQEQPTTGGTQPGGTGGAADAGAQQRGMMALDGGTMMGADAGMGGSADGGIMLGADGGMGGAADSGMMGTDGGR